MKICIKLAAAALALLSAPALVQADGIGECPAYMLNHDSDPNPPSISSASSSYPWILHRPRNRKSNSSFHPSNTYWGRSDWDWQAWEKAGMKNGLQKDLTFQIINAPPKANVKYIVIVAAGQQTSSGFANAISGHSSYWRKKNNANNDLYFDDPLHTMIYPIDKRSPAYRLINGLSASGNNGLGSSQWSIPSLLSNTLVINIFDAAFGFTNSDDNKAAAVVGWYNFLKAGLDWSKIEAFIGYGMSRGACFVTKFSDWLIRVQGMKDLKVILETVDAVCEHKEIGWLPQTDLQNPLTTDNDKKCQVANLKLLHNPLPRTDGGGKDPEDPAVKPQLFTINAGDVLYNKSNVCWRNVFGGASAFVGIGRAFCNVGTASFVAAMPGNQAIDNPPFYASASNFAYNGKNWLEQVWINKQHCQMGRTFPSGLGNGDYHNRALEHLTSCFNRYFPNGYSCPAWPTTCTAYTNGKCGGFKTRTCTMVNTQTGATVSQVQTQLCSTTANPCIWGPELTYDPIQCRKSTTSTSYKIFYNKCGAVPAKSAGITITPAMTCQYDGQHNVTHKPIAFCGWGTCFQPLDGSKRLRKACNTPTTASPVYYTSFASQPGNFDWVTGPSTDEYEGAGFKTIYVPPPPSTFVQLTNSLSATPELQEQVNIYSGIGVGGGGSGTLTPYSTNPHCGNGLNKPTYILSSDYPYEATLYQDC